VGVPLILDWLYDPNPTAILPLSDLFGRSGAKGVGQELGQSRRYTLAQIGEVISEKNGNLLPF